MKHLLAIFLLSCSTILAQSTGNVRNSYWNGTQYSTGTWTGSGVAGISSTGAPTTLSVSGTGSILSGGGDASSTTINQERWLMATFLSGEDLLRFNVSSDGTNWNKVGGIHFRPASGGVRDPQILRYSGTWWVAYTNGNFGASTTFSIINSPDLSNWTAVANPSVASVPSAASTWSPIWLNDSGTIRAMVGVGPNTGASGGVGMTPYLLTATTSNLTGWSAPAAMTNATSWPGEFIPVNLVKVSGTYNLFGSVYTSGTVTLQRYTSTVATGPYTASTAYSYTGTNFEGVSWVQTGTGTQNWRGYIDRYTLGGIYTITSTNTFQTISTPTLIGAIEYTSSNCGVYRATSLEEIAQIDKMVAVSKQNRPNPIGVYDPGTSFYNGSIGAAFDSGFRNVAIFSNVYQAGGTGSVSYARYDTSRVGLLHQLEYDLSRFAWYATPSNSNSLGLLMNLSGVAGTANLSVSGTVTSTSGTTTNLSVGGTLSGNPAWRSQPMYGIWTGNIGTGNIPLASFSTTGTTWSAFPLNITGTTPVTNPSPVYWNGRYVLAACNISTISESNSSFSIYTSFDGVNYNFTANVSCSAVSGVNRVWAPELFVDLSGNLYAYVSCGSGGEGGNFATYYTTPTDSTLTSWNAVSAITGTGLPTNSIDASVVQTGSNSYVLTLRNISGGDFINQYTSSSPTSGWIASGTGNALGFGSATYEAPNVVRLLNGNYIMYLDRYSDGTGIYYSLTGTNPTTGWSAPVAISSNGTILRHGSAFVPDSVPLSNFFISALVNPASSFRFTATNGNAAIFENSVSLNYDRAVGFLNRNSGNAAYSELFTGQSSIGPLNQYVGLIYFNSGYSASNLARPNTGGIILGGSGTMLNLVAANAASTINLAVGGYGANTVRMTVTNTTVNIGGSGSAAPISGIYTGTTTLNIVNLAATTGTLALVAVPGAVATNNPTISVGMSGSLVSGLIQQGPPFVIATGTVAVPFYNTLGIAASATTQIIRVHVIQP